MPEPFGAIGDKWKKLGGAGSIIGNAITGEKDTSDGGKFQEFEKLNGRIYWHPKTGAFCVLGLIFHRCKALGEEKFGYPITDETATSDRVGRFNHFRAFKENGQTSDSSIFWHPSTGAHEIFGAIRDKWASLGSEKSNLGYPTNGEVKLIGGSVTLPPGATLQQNRRRIQDFQGGSLIWNSSTGQVLTRRVEGSKTTLTFDSGFVTTDIHLGGSYKIVLNNAGESTFSGRFHNSGITNIDYVLAAVIMTPSGIGYTFTHTGHTDGDIEIGGDNNDNFMHTGFSQQIKDNWKTVSMAALVSRVEARDTLVGGINKLIEDIAEEGIKKLVLGAVSYVLIGVSPTV